MTGLLFKHRSKSFVVLERNKGGVIIGLFFFLFPSCLFRPAAKILLVGLHQAQHLLRRTREQKNRETDN